MGADIFPMTMCCQKGGLPEEIGVAQLRESRAPCRRQIDLALLNKIQPHCGVADPIDAISGGILQARGRSPESSIKTVFEGRIFSLLISKIRVTLLRINSFTKNPGLHYRLTQYIAFGNHLKRLGNHKTPVARSLTERRR